MAEPFVGEIRMFAGTFAPRGWADCDGQLLDVSQNDLLFSLFGTIYGGDGRTTFGLPDLRGRVPVHHGGGPGLSNYHIGEKGGAEQVTLLPNQLPSHTHPVHVDRQPATETSPAGGFLAQPEIDAFAEEPASGTMASQTITSRGGSSPHTNLQPFLVIRFIVALVGVYPSRS